MPVPARPAHLGIWRVVWCGDVIGSNVGDVDDGVAIVGVVDGGDQPAHASVGTRRGETGGRGSWATFERMAMMMIRMVKAMLTMI